MPFSQKVGRLKGKGDSRRDLDLGMRGLGVEPGYPLASGREQVSPPSGDHCKEQAEL